MPWRKADADNFVREEMDIKETVQLSKLKARLAKLKTIHEPTEQEKLSWAKLRHPTFEEMLQAKTEYMRLKGEADQITDSQLKEFSEEMHPYYSAQDEINELEALISTLEAL